MRKRVPTAVCILLLAATSLYPPPAHAAGFDAIPATIGGYLAGLFNLVTGLLSDSNATASREREAVAASQGSVNAQQTGDLSSQPSAINPSAASAPPATVTRNAYVPAGASPALAVSRNGAVTETQLDHKLAVLQAQITAIAGQPPVSSAALLQSLAFTNAAAGNSTGATMNNVIVNRVTGLSAADIPNLASTYLSTAGGTIAGTLTVTGAFSGSTLSLANASTTLFSVLGPAYFGTTATSTFGTDGTLTLAKALSAANGGTGWTNINAGSILFGNGAAALATSSSLFWDNTNSRLGIGSTTPSQPLSVSGNAYVSGNLTLGGSITGSYTLGGTPTITGLAGVTSQSGQDLSFTFTSTRPASFNTTTGTIDNSSASYPNARVVSHIATLQPSVDTSNIWENIFSQVEVKGTHNQIGEVNLSHSYFQLDAGATAQQVEDYEASGLNSGTLDAFNNFLALLENGASANTTNIIAYKAQLKNDNTTAASVGQYAALDMEAMSGGGSLPTGYYFLRNAESNAVSVTAGTLSVGTLSSTAAGLLVRGSDTSSNTSVLSVQDSGTNQLTQIFDNGDFYIQKGVLKLGTSNNWGKLFLGNTTSGSIQVSAPSSGALNGSITIPNANDTLVGRATTDTLTNKTYSGGSFAGTISGAATFSGNLILSGANTQSGSYAVTGSSLPTQAPGTLGVAGTATKPTLSTNSEGNIWLTSTGGLSFIGQGSNNEVEFYNETGALAWSMPKNTTNMNIAGSIGIATTSPWRTLSVTGTVGFDGLSSVSTNQTAYLCLSANKEVVQDSTTCLASSARFKQDITPLSASSSLAEVMALNPVSFEYTPAYNGALQGDPNFSGTFVGFIAEQVAQIDPRLITVDATGTTPTAPHGVRYENITAILAGAAKQIANELASLEATVAGFAQSFTTKQLCVADGTGAKTCITKAQLDAILSQSSQTGQGSVPPTSAMSPDASSSPPTITITDPPPDMASTIPTVPTTPDTAGQETATSTPTP